MPNQINLPRFFNDRKAGKVRGMRTPQQLSRKAIEEFKIIYREELGREISDDEAQIVGLRLLGLFKILLQPVADGISDQNATLPPHR